MPTPRTHLPAALADRPFTVAEGRALGLSKRAMRNPDLRAPYRGVRVPAHLPDDLRTKCVALSLVLPPGAVMAGATAAALWGLPLPRALDPQQRPDLPLEVGVPQGGPRPRIDGVIVRYVPPARRAAPVGQLLLVRPAAAWAGLGSRLSLDDLVVLGDAVARRDGSRARLEHALARPGRLAGRALLVRALRLVRERVDSPQETRTRLLLVRAGVPEPEVNVAVHDEHGGWLAQPDMSWPRARVVLEYLGDVHRVRKGRWRADVRRREVLEENGWKVLFATADELSLWPDQLVDRVRRALVERGALV